MKAWLSGRSEREMLMSNDPEHTLAGIEYCGIAGISKDCKRAVMRLLQYGDKITRVRILSSPMYHCLLLNCYTDDLVAIKSGFASGYVGEGPRTFSYILQLLDAHNIPIEEYEVPSDVIERVNESALTVSDIENLDAACPVQPTRWHDYILKGHEESKRKGTLWEEFPALVPFAIIDSRIIDLAILFREDPAESLSTGYQRLEDIVRGRTGIDAYGARLFYKAFNGPAAKLGWKGLDEGGQASRALLFIGAFAAYQNPWTHLEAESGINHQLANFLLLNHLYCLEQSAS